MLVRFMELTGSPDALLPITRHIHGIRDKHLADLTYERDIPRIGEMILFESYKLRVVRGVAWPIYPQGKPEHMPDVICLVGPTGDEDQWAVQGLHTIFHWTAADLTWPQYEEE